MLTASLIARNGQSLVDWKLPKIEQGTTIPRILRWPTSFETFRYFAMEPATCKRIGTDDRVYTVVADYHECDEPLTIGVL
jgi:hypothetical protein